MSTRPAVLPADYIAALSRLQDTVIPVTHEKIAVIIESELGAPISELFQSFDSIRLEVEHFDQAVKSINRATNRLSLSIIAASFIIGGKFAWDSLQKTLLQGGNKRK